MRRTLALLIIVMGLTFAVSAQAEPDGGMGHGCGHGKEMERDGKHDSGPGWKETLTDEQKLKVDKMHLELKKETGLLEARLGVEKAELAGLLVKDAADMKAIQKRLDEMARIKRDMMEKKYRHMLDVRAILTPEQRVSFDMGVLKMAGDGRDRMGH